MLANHEDYQQLVARVGRTPLVKWGRYEGATIWVKLEGQNPSGSLKDRHIIGILTDLEQKGDLNPNKEFIDTSSGSYASALAMWGAVLGMKVNIVTRETIEASYKNYFEYVGGKLVLYGRNNAAGHDHCCDLFEQNPDKYIFTDQMNNPAAAWEHETTAREILETLDGDVSAIFTNMGSGANLAGMKSHVDKIGHDLQFYAVTQTQDPNGSFVGTWKEGYVEAFYAEKFKVDPTVKEIQTSYTEGVKIWKDDLLARAITVGQATGGAMEAAQRAIREDGLTGNIVLLSGNAFGWNLPA